MRECTLLYRHAPASSLLVILLASPRARRADLRNLRSFRSTKKGKSSTYNSVSFIVSSYAHLQLLTSLPLQYMTVRRSRTLPLRFFLADLLPRLPPLNSHSNSTASPTIPSLLPSSPTGQARRTQGQEPLAGPTGTDEGGSCPVQGKSG